MSIMISRAKVVQEQAVSKKIAKIMKEGVRPNTKKPLSKKNKRRTVSKKQAKAIAYSIVERKKSKKK